MKRCLTFIAIFILSWASLWAESPMSSTLIEPSKSKAFLGEIIETGVDAAGRGLEKYEVRNQSKKSDTDSNFELNNIQWIKVYDGGDGKAISGMEVLK